MGAAIGIALSQMYSIQLGLAMAFGAALGLVAGAVIDVIARRVRA